MSKNQSAFLILLIVYDKHDRKGLRNHIISCMKLAFKIIGYLELYEGTAIGISESKPGASIIRPH